MPDNSEKRKFIETIRAEEYLLGVEASPQINKGADSIRRKLGKALKLLSEELYASETHFVLELVQNADDNTYPPGIAPSLHVALHQNEIVVSNNEIGFSEKNVVAICTLGESTKAKRAGFIGEKGIGFKSVFKVSDCPEVHSNDFHFRFDRAGEDNLLGYVVPSWCTDWEKRKFDNITTIVLPAKQGRKFCDDDVSSLSAELLLFLRNLRKISIKYASGTSATYERQDSKKRSTLTIYRKNLVDLTTKESQSFVSVRHLFSTTDIEEEKRPKTEESEVVLAFPVEKDGRAICENTQQLFAFLPIRNFGFRFLVQGDFLLSSSREDVMRELPWNRRIRDEIANAFVVSLDTLKLDRMTARTFLNFIPRKGEVTDHFFTPVVLNLLKKLAQEECVLGATGSWRKPVDIVIDRESFSELVSGDDLSKLFGKDYASPDLLLEDDVLERLGCQSLSIDIIATLFVEYADWVIAQGVLWLARLYAFLAKEVDAADIAILKKTPCVRLATGQFVDLIEYDVFFPLGRKKKYGFESEINFVDDEILEVEPALTEVVEDFLRRLGVRQTDPYSWITNHVLPRHASDQWKESDANARVGHIRYIKDHLDKYLSGAEADGKNKSSAIGTLSSTLRLRCKKTDGNAQWFSLPNSLYLSAEYEPAFTLEDLLGASADPARFLAADYLAPGKKSPAKDDLIDARRAWRSFFREIGVNEFPRVDSRPTSGGSSDFIPSGEMELLIRSNDAAVLRQTLEMLDRNWSNYAGYSHVLYSGRLQGTIRESAFVTALRAMIVPTKRKKGIPLSMTYVDVESVRAVFGSSPAYLDVNTANREFMDVCGIVYDADLDACLRRLDQIRGEEKPQLQIIRRVYRRIEQLAETLKPRIREAFSGAPRIFVGDGPRRWCTSTQVSWESNGALLDSHFPPIARPYAEHRSFFRNIVGVAHELPMSALIDALSAAEEFEGDDDDLRAGALKVYRRASNEIADAKGRNGEFPAWLHRFKSEKLFVDHLRRFVQPDNDLYIDDLPRVSIQLTSCEQLSFLAIERQSIPQLQELIETLKIPKLSEVIKYQMTGTIGGELDASRSKLIQSRWLAIARLIYTENNTAYERAGRDGAWELLRKIEVAHVPTLQVQASVNSETATIDAQIFTQGHQIFALAGLRGLTDRLAREICTLLGAKVALVDAISRILIAATDEELAEFLEIKGISEIPEDQLLKLKPAIAGKSDQFSQALEEPSIVEPVAQQEDIAGESATGHAAVEDSGDAGVNTRTALPTPIPSGDTLPSGLKMSSADGIRQPAASGNFTPSAMGQSTSMTFPSTSRSSQKRNRTSARTTSGGRLLSYAEPTPPKQGDGTIAPDDSRAQIRDEISRAAVDAVLELASGDWAKLTEMDHFNKGFDILAHRADGNEEYIEVKGQSGAWTETGVALTNAELAHAEKHRERYWLYVVAYALDPKRREIYRIQNPFGSTNQFRFDSGWKSISTATLPNTIRPERGIRIDIPNVGAGVIVSAKRGGNLFKLHVQLDSGKQVNRVYNPTTMLLTSK